MELRCRLCAQEKRLDDIECTIKEQRINVRQMLLDCCRWSKFEGVEYENLPKIVCKACFVRLKQSWSFANSVASAQQFLLDVSTAFAEEESTCVAFDLKMEMEINSSNDAGIASIVDVDHSDADDKHSYTDDRNSYTDDNIDRDSLPDNANQNIVDNADRNNDVQQGGIDSMETEEMLPLLIGDHTYKLMDHIRKEECNSDGTISIAGVRRLQLFDYSMLKLRCHVCEASEESLTTLRQHIRDKHPDATCFLYICVFCKKKFDTKSSKIYRHMRRQHLRYLEHW